MDAVILAQRKEGQIIVTGDNHFKGIKNVKLI